MQIGLCIQMHMSICIALAYESACIHRYSHARLEQLFLGYNLNLLFLLYP